MLIMGSTDSLMFHAAAFQVWVRNHTTVRSILIGFVAAFDKHLNIALVDVDELVLLRPATIKCPTLTPLEQLTKLEVSHNEQAFLTSANLEIGKQISSDCNSTSVSSDSGKITGTLATTSATDLASILPCADAANTNQDSICENSERNATKAVESSPDTASKLTKPSQRKRRLRNELLQTKDFQRFVPQLFIRGENIVLVTFADANSTKNKSESYTSLQYEQMLSSSAV